MNLQFVSNYKSIRDLPIAHLPSLTVLTGENGSGKTHFLNALKEEAITIDGVSSREIRYYTWGNMIPSHQTSLVPRNLSNPISGNEIAKLSEGVFEDLLEDIRLSLASHGTSPVMTKECLTSTVSNTSPFADLPKEAQILVSKSIDTYRLCIKASILGGIRAGIMGVNYKYPGVQENYGMTREDGIYRNKDLNRNKCFFLLKLLDNRKDFFNLKAEEIENYIPLLEEAIDPFQGSLTALFGSYINEREKNDLAEIRHRRGDADSFFTDSEFIERFGLPPWQVLNDVLAVAKLPFRFKNPHPDANKQLAIELEHLDAKIIIGFGDLSSGERILISLAQFVFLSNYERQLLDMPKVVLLDEVDAPLHPSVVEDLLRIVKTVMVDQYGLQVIMVTHSPSTVALAPEESLYVLEKTSKQIRKVSRDEGIHVLTAGVPVLSVKLENRRQVFVESEYDAACYERIVQLLRKYLRPELSFVFIPSGTKGGGSCDRVKELVNKLSEGGNESVYGVVDWDLHYNGNKKVRVLGRGNRYSIENYLFDPLSVAILLYQMRLVGREVLTLSDDQTYADLRHFDDAQLQIVVDNILQHLGLAADQAAPARACTYLNGRTVHIPTAYLEMQGHALEAHIKGTSPVFGKFRNDGALKLEIVDKVLGELPGFLSTDFLDLLRGIQTG